VLNASPGEARQGAIGRTRIGASFGEALVGTFGGAQRLDFTAHGPAVNLAARLQHAAKALGETVLASGALVAAAGRPPGWRRVADLTLQGFEDAQEAHALERAVEPVGPIGLLRR
jgi:class 3 adenylate cyclase